MTICFVGTGAADYSPLLQTAFKETLDKDARRSSSVLIDGHILIDCGEYVVESLEIQKIPLSDINILLLTHLHEDHYQPENIGKIAYAHERKLHIYAHRSARTRLIKELADYNVEIHTFDYCHPRKVQGGITMTGLPANHTEYPSHYLLEHDGKSIYYATDGAWIRYEAYYYLENKKLDAMIVDATVGDYVGDYRVAEHNSIPMIRLMLKSFHEIDICDEHTRVILTHIAPSLHKPHEEIVTLMAQEDIEVAFDGWKTNI